MVATATEPAEQISEWMDPKEVAAFVGVSNYTLKRWRCRTCHNPPDLPWHKPHGRVRYRRSEVMAFMQRRRRTRSEDGPRPMRPAPMPQASAP